MGTSIFIVVPAYNEGRVIESILKSLIRLNYSIVVVDDGSGDNTWSVINELPVYALRHRINLGQGAALATGLKFSLQRGADILVLFDADGQHRIEDINVLIKPLLAKQADVVFGCRFFRAADRALIPRLRRILLKGAVIVNRLMTGVWLHDAHNGFIALTRGAAEQIQLRQKGFAYHSEMLTHVGKLGLRYTERPTMITYSEYSRAKGQSMWNAVNIVVDLMLGRVFR